MNITSIKCIQYDYIIKYIDIKYSFIALFNYVKGSHMVEYPELLKYYLCFTNKVIKTQIIYAPSHIF